MLKTYAIWSFIYTLYKCIELNERSAAKILCFFIEGQYHLWFLWMISGLYVITPLVREIIKKPELIKYFIGISLIFSFAIPTIQSMTENILPMVNNEKLTMIISTLWIPYNNIAFSFTLRYVSYFVLGYYLHSYEIHIGKRVIIYVFGIAGAIFTIFYSLFIARKVHQNFGFYEYMFFNVLLEACAIFVLIKRIAYNIRIPQVVNVFHFLGKKSFGIYLVHVLVLEILAKYFKITPLMWDFPFSTLIIATLIFIISLIFTVVIDRIKWISKGIFVKVKFFASRQIQYREK